MAEKIIGIERLDYTNKAGRVVKGYSLHLSEEKSGVFGEVVFNAFINDERFAPILAKYPDLAKAVGTKVHLQYNRYGKVDGCTPA